MKQMAIFVEGQTEQIFAEHLLRAMAGRNCISIHLLKGTGGNKFSRQFTLLQATAASGELFRVLIYDCGTDNRVLSDIRDHYANLAQQGYDRIIGLRDVFPSTAADVGRIEQLMNPYLPTGSVPVAIVLAVTEIEAWFLGEETHYERVDARLTASVVASALGLPAEQAVVELIPHPSSTLDRIYAAAGLRYRKDRRTVQHTVGALDCTHLYVQVASRIPALSRFISEIDEFLSGSPGNSAPAAVPTPP